VALAMCGDDDAGIQDAESQMFDQGVPTVSIKLQTPADIGGSIFVWEVATALACSLMGVNSFATRTGAVGAIDRWQSSRIWRLAANCRR
jgi:hypothetical protein